ncbi:MAG TPA: ADOP family duplicated permease, partial [Gemmatimonadales bacterium]
ATVLSVANVLLVRAPAGVLDPGPLITAHAVSEDGSGFHSFSWLDWRDLAAAPSGLEDLAVYSGFPASIATDDEPRLRLGMLVSGNYFRMLRTQPALGRFFGPDEDAGPGGPRVVVLSHTEWRDRFAGDPGILGRSIRVNGEPFTVIGVAEAGFRGHSGLLEVSLFVPVTLDPVVSHRQILEVRNSGWLEMVGRRGPGVSLERAEAALSTNYAATGRAAGRDWDRAVDLREWAPVEAPIVGPVTGFLGLLLVLAGLILLIASANVANVLLARAAARAREIAVRLAIGANRSRLVRQLLTESVVLFAVGGVGGTLLAIWATGLLSGLRPPVGIPLLLEFPLDIRVLLIALAVTLTVGLLFGLVPALQSTRPDLSIALKEQPSLARVGRFRLRTAFVAAQVGGTTLLLVVAGLFVRALGRAGDIDIGFEPANVHALLFELEVRYPDAAQAPALVERMEERLGMVPGVLGVGAVRNVPLTRSRSETVIAIEGRAAEPGVGWFQTDFSQVTPGYFAVAGVPILKGRGFGPADREGAAAVAIVNQTLAGRVWPGEEVVGKVFRFGSVEDGTPTTIIGVARNAKYNSLGEDPVSMVYVPFAQQPERSIALLAQLAPGSPDPTPAMAAAVREVDQFLPIVQNAPLTELIGLALLPNRMAVVVATLFGATGLTLAAVGLYGLLAFVVSRRRREIGIRMALGATAGRVRNMILRDGMKPVLLGLGLGFLAAAMLARLLGSLLYGLSPLDPMTYGTIALLLTGVALAASLVPARRATVGDPVDVLRHD